MKRTLIAAAAALIALTGSAGVATAQPGDSHDHDRGGQEQGRGHDNGHDQGHGYGQGHDQSHGGYVRHDDWKRGHRLAREDWSRGERVDYRQHHLRAPPRGYEWREVDGNYVLAAVATGLIASIIANSR